MNILHVSDIDIYSHAGGMNTVIPELIKRQINYDNTINNALFIVQKKLGKDEVYPFPILYMEGNYVKKICSFNLLVFHSVYNLKFMLLFFFCRKYHIPYIIVSHGGLSKVALRKNFIKKKIFKFLFLDSFVKRSLSLCFTSRDEQLNSIYRDKKYIIVPNPIQLSSCSYRVNGNKLNGIQIVYLSKIDFYYKGLDVLFDSLDSIRDNLAQEDVCLTFYGYGNTKSVDLDNIPSSEKDILKLLKRISDLNLGPKVQYQGPLFGIDKMDVLKNSDIYILTSRSEAMPLSISEALSVGTPCLVTYGTNMSSMIKEYGAGWTTDLKQDSLASMLLVALKEYREDPYKFRRAARKLYEINNSIDIGEASILEYKRLCSKQ